MSNLVNYRAGWNNAGDQQDITRNYGIFQKCGDRQMHGRPGKSPVHSGGQDYTSTGRSRTKNPLLFEFPSSKETTGVICKREPVIDSAH